MKQTVRSVHGNKRVTLAVRYNRSYMCSSVINVYILRHARWCCVGCVHTFIT